ncbi:MAG: nitrate reductase [Gammaproteobacteria bacterium]|nr:nitrate reductase [Gammaproteobacteria bacterium]NIN39625.1 nitrate reductase [Gammaproteobacteria bacterium]NIO25182.1 nitrate reductase [Gammaproteobacteria bacterium]NIO65811.1 nitrate reductase [Gammaproteobacteria bacterium]NIP45750.1 nitrate reductase [Gammaproteobacteria bacterium]
MSTLTVIYALLLYAATLILIVGLGYRINRYARTPSPLKIPTTPAPTTAPGVVLRMLGEITLFTSLFKASKPTWIFGWLFHFGLLLVLLGHLRYFIEPVWGWVAVAQQLGVYAGSGMLVGLAGLWLRRIVVDRVRYISSPSDHLMLALLIAIAATGLGMRTVSHTDIVALKGFVLGLLAFDWQPLPADGLLLTHLALVALLMMVFPVSKLLHAPAVFFSPTRVQVDDPREKRHLAPWAAELERGGQR